LESTGHPKKALYAVSKSMTSNCIVSMLKFSLVPKVTGRAIRLTGDVAAQV
jgi:hypothetical protein